MMVILVKIEIVPSTPMAAAMKFRHDSLSRAYSETVKALM